MPATEVVFFRGDDQSCPVLDWLHALKDKKAVAACLDRLNLLGEYGHELRRPVAAPLRDGIHELRVRCGNVHYRILYAFVRGKALLLHGCTKVDLVAASDIERAIGRRQLYETAPVAHEMEI